LKPARQPDRELAVEPGSERIGRVRHAEAEVESPGVPGKREASVDERGSGQRGRSGAACNDGE
jgi:hypothetical protein